MSGAGGSQEIQFTADGNTPSEYLSYDGKIYEITPAYMTTLGSTPAESSKLLGIPGYHVAGGPTGHEWLMIDPLPTAVTTGILAIPVRGWLALQSLWTFRAYAATLLANGVSSGDTLHILTALYNAAMSEINGAPLPVPVPLTRHITSRRMALLARRGRVRHRIG